MIPAVTALPARRTRVVAPYALAVCLLVVAGCGANAGGAATSAPSLSPAPTAGAPASGEPRPEPTRWPGTTVQAVVALGAADGELWKAGTDLGLAAEPEDLVLMRGAADGLVTFITELTPNIERLAAYPYTEPLAERYRAAFPIILDGATTLRDAIDAGDAAGIAAGSERLAEGLRAYGEVRALLREEAYVDQAIAQKRLLLR